MPSIKEFVEAMNASWPAALAILMACAGLLAGDYADLKYLQGLPSWSMGVVFVVGIFAASVVLVRIVQLLFSAVLFPVRKMKQKKAIRAHIARLDEINSDEAHILIWAVQQNRQAFVATFDDARLAPLMTKGFVERIGGSHSILEWPYRIPNHIWDELKRQLRSSPDAEIVPNPFPSRW